MADLFRQVGIYSPLGQLYEPEDSAQISYYKEAKNGQILEEGINEAGAIASWVAAGTSYSTNGLAMLPFYIFYSMFGFQRVGDLLWAAADSRTRGFLLGATAGRTTLSGEGLQHEDGTSHLIASTVPNCRAYDPCYAHELAVIVEHGMRRMLTEQRDEFYYVTVMNENYAQPSAPGPKAARDASLEPPPQPLPREGSNPGSGMCARASCAACTACAHPRSGQRACGCSARARSCAKRSRRPRCWKPNSASAPTCTR